MREAVRTPRQHRVCLLLGSNIQPEQNLMRAVSLLRRQFKVEQVSSTWESPAVGSAGPNFLNTAVVIRTTKNPRQLKDEVLRPIEAQLGRVRVVDKNAPRTIDIDIVAWDADILDRNVWKYAHAAVPVAELIPSYQSEETGEYLEQAAKRLKAASPIQIRPEVSTSFAW